MMSEEIQSLLQRFKDDGANHAECVHPLIRDPILRNLIILWPITPVGFHLPASRMPESENEKWKWLWGGVEYDKGELANSLRLDIIKLTHLVDRAIAFRLIYPDGTTNSLATQFVQSEIAKSLSKKPGRPPGP